MVYVTTPVTDSEYAECSSNDSNFGVCCVDWDRLQRRTWRITS